MKLRKRQRLLFPGPILVVTTTNHAVDEFLLRCRSFTEEVSTAIGSAGSLGSSSFPVKQHFVFGSAIRSLSLKIVTGHFPTLETQPLKHTGF